MEEIKQKPEVKKEKFVKLISGDNKEFVVPLRILDHSPILKEMLEGSFRESKYIFEA
jgi:hypothetical protein